MDPILDARGIHAWYGSSHVLRGVDLKIGLGVTRSHEGRVGIGRSSRRRTQH